MPVLRRRAREGIELGCDLIETPRPMWRVGAMGQRLSRWLQAGAATTSCMRVDPTCFRTWCRVGQVAGVLSQGLSVASVSSRESPVNNRRWGAVAVETQARQPHGEDLCGLQIGLG